MAGRLASNSEQGAPSGARSRIWLPLSLVVLVGLAYANAIDHPFVYDDLVLVVKNPEIRSLRHVPALIGFEEEGFQLKTRWTRDVTYALEHAAVGLQPAYYHATNVVLHALVGLLVYFLFASVGRDRWLGWWTAALFVVHPLNTEVVSQVSGRRGLLAAVFSLSAILLLCSYSRRGGAWRMAGALILIYLGVFSKELAVLAPVAFVALDVYGRWMSRRRQAGRSALADLLDEVGARFKLYTGLGVFTIAITLSVLFLSPDVGGPGGLKGFYDTYAGGLDPIDRFRLSGMALRLLVLPVGQTVDYSFDALRLVSSGPSLAAVVDLSVLVAGIALAVAGLVGRRWWGIAAVWMFLFYLPHSGVISWHEIFAERFLYLPGIGFAFAVAAAGAALAGRGPSWRRWSTAAGGIALVLLTGATMRRNEVWASSMALWTDAAARYPNCARAHKALGDILLREDRHAPALDHYETASAILPVYKDARIAVAVAQTELYRYGEALETLSSVLAIWPGSPKALNERARIQLAMGHREEALASYEAAVQADPQFADGYNNLARLYVEQGDLPRAVEMLEKALEINPALLPALDNLAIVYRRGFNDPDRASYYEARAREVRGTF